MPPGGMPPGGMPPGGMPPMFRPGFPGMGPPQGMPPPPQGFPGMPPQGFPGAPPLPGAPPPTPAPGAAPTHPRPESNNMPHNTLYLNNLTEKEKIESLKKALYHIFSQFGEIIEITAKKALKLKGQAWIVFEKVDSAVKARAEMQGFNFFGKPMNVDFANVKSDVISQKDGTFVPRPKRKIEKKKKKKGEKKKKKPKTEDADEDLPGPPPPPVNGAPTANEPKPFPPPPQPTQAPPAPKPKPPPRPQGPIPPNRILFVENLPDQCTDLMLSMLLQQYQGFKEARLVTGKPGIAFVEFSDQFQATVAKDNLQSFMISPGHPMKITFARQ
mmetsp:Transcript_50628/g.99142  ORF Transcript_50628/g.99142 Transcript_50628/m.99142 type:complete len:328 (-) Transcript_50628:349-1332(-)